MQHILAVHVWPTCTDKVYSVYTVSQKTVQICVLKADVRNCCTTQKVVICSKLSNDLISTQ